MLYLKCVQLLFHDPWCTRNSNGLFLLKDKLLLQNLYSAVHISMLLFIVFTTTIIIMSYNDYFMKNITTIFLMPFLELEGADGKKIISYGNVSEINSRLEI